MVMKRTLTGILKGLGILLILTGAIKYKLVSYGISQLNGQLKIIIHSVKIEEALKDPLLPDSLKQRLLLINEIRAFAFDSLGLKRNNNYTTFYNQHGKPVLWTVTGCERFRLKAFQWWFPFLGKVSYKGFFVKEKAQKEFEKLRRKGLDAEYSPVGGWSTLGWFTDPVLSNMLRRRAGSLAELIIHELTHGTVYLRSSVDLNENLATFVGEQGAILFLKSKFGENADELKVYQNFKSDEEIFGRYILQGAESLDSMYLSSSFKEMEFAEKLGAKYNLIARIMSGIGDLNLNNKKYYLHNFKTDPLPDNTFFMSYLRYRKKQDLFSEELDQKFKNNLREFIVNYSQK